MLASPADPGLERERARRSCAFVGNFMRSDRVFFAASAGPREGHASPCSTDAPPSHNTGGTAQGAGELGIRSTGARERAAPGGRRFGFHVLRASDERAPAGTGGALRAISRRFTGAGISGIGGCSFTSQLKFSGSPAGAGAGGKAISRRFAGAGIFGIGGCSFKSQLKSSGSPAGDGAGGKGVGGGSCVASDGAGASGAASNVGDETVSLVGGTMPSSSSPGKTLKYFAPLIGAISRRYNGGGEPGCKPRAGERSRVGHGGGRERCSNRAVASQ